MNAKRLLLLMSVAAGLGLPNAALAQSTTAPGETVGLAPGVPLPEGVYALNTFIYGRLDQPNAPDSGPNIPILIWSTPLKPLDGRIELIIGQATVFAYSRNPAGVRNQTVSVNSGTFLGAAWAFDLGGHFNVSFLGGAYTHDWNGDRGSIIGPQGTTVTPVVPVFASTAYRFGMAASYTGDGYNLTANFTTNFYDSPGRFGGLAGAAVGPVRISDALLLDLTATKKFGKFEVGAIGYGTYNFDTSQFSAAAGNRGRFALGGLVGYDFGPFVTQLYVAHDVATAASYTDAFGRVRGNYATEGFFRVFVPLYTPEPVTEQPLVRRREREFAG